MRRRRTERREPQLDPRYQSPLVSRFINVLMVDGKKSIAERIIYRAFDLLEKQAGEPALPAFQKAIENARPLLEVKSRRVGGATYQVPVEVRYERSLSLAFRWIRDFARSRKGAAMEQRLATEWVDAYRKQGSAVRKKEDTHKMAEANRAFAHYRW